MGEFSDLGFKFIDRAKRMKGVSSQFFSEIINEDSFDLDIKPKFFGNMAGSVMVKNKSGATHLLQLAVAEESEGPKSKHVERKLIRRVREWAAKGHGLNDAKIIFCIYGSPCESCTNHIWNECVDLAHSISDDGKFEFSFIFKEWFVAGKTKANDPWPTREDAENAYADVMLKSIKDYRSGGRPAVKVLIRHYDETSKGSKAGELGFKYAFSG